ncbi:MAG: type II secretion system F family protein [Saccharospirillum sp.]|nr:type II secretion system F family protein [Saccharospirillum sp.]
MAEFYYQGRTADGQSVEGQLEASSQSAVLQQLKRQSIIATRVEPAKTKQRKRESTPWLERLQSKQVSADELIMFCRQMYALSRSGIPLMRAINGLADVTRSARLGEILHDVARSLGQGTALSTALRAHPETFNDLFIAMVRMGESTGRIDTAFKQLVDHLELEKDTRKKVASAVRYPIIVVSAILIAILVINLFVIPAFANVFDRLGADMPLPTRILIATSDFLLATWPYLIALTVLGIYALLRWKKTPEGAQHWDRMILRLPLLGGIFERIALGRFARPFAMMLDAGVPLLQALRVASKTVGNRHIGQGVEGMLNGIERGESLLVTASASGMFNPLILQMIAVGEETGNVGDLLVDIADFYDQEVEYDLKRLAEAIEPILLVFMGAMVLVLALGVFLPMWDLGSAFGG